MVLLEKAKVNWMLSVDAADLPEHIRAAGKTTYRNLTIGAEAFEFSGGFTELHTRSYADILSGGGFGITEAKPAIELVHEIRNGGASFF